jgi:sugar transferase (PEP-CTERM/EpsH1 system associated)
MRHVWAREGRTLLAYERAAAAACERTLLVTQDEVRRLEVLAPELRGKLDWLEQGVDLEKFSPDLHFDTPYPDAAPRLVLTGNMDYWPNADAAIWFAQNVLPLLRTRTPAPAFVPEFIIVGANPGPEVRALSQLPGVVVTGRVPDVRPYVAHAAAVVVPLRMARGIQNKVLEGMAMARPVIASGPAFEGVRAQPGRDLLVADGEQAFAARIAEVLDGQHPGLPASGRAAMQAGYAWSAVMDKLDHILAPPAG